MYSNSPPRILPTYPTHRSESSSVLRTLQRILNRLGRMDLPGADQFEAFLRHVARRNRPSEPLVRGRRIEFGPGREIRSEENVDRAALVEGGVVCIERRSRDEIGLLGDHFNRMLARINQFNVELTRRIEAATRELAEKNEELRLANESLYQAQLKLVRTEKLSALGQMAATMAHEIGTPLNSISGYIQLMLTEGAGSEVTTKRLKIIDSQLERLTQIIRNLLQSTKQPVPRLRAVDINQLLENLINLTQPGMAMRGIQLIRQLHASLAPIAGDAELLAVILRTGLPGMASNVVSGKAKAGLCPCKRRASSATNALAIGGLERAISAITRITLFGSFSAMSII